MQRARARIELRYYMIFTIRRVCVCFVCPLEYRPRIHRHHRNRIVRSRPV